MENSGNQNQSRFLIAAVLSMVVLFGWSYFFAPKPPPADTNANVAANTNTNTATPAPAPTAQAPTQPVAAQPVTPDTTPNRKITIKSRLYEVTLDSKGALATSWILLKNESPRSQFPVFADGSTETDQRPLELISPEALTRSPQEIPFRLGTADQALNELVNGRNYQISAAEETITLTAGQEKQIDFTLTDASGVEVKKSFVFRADSYISDLAVTLKKDGQPVPNTKLMIGASIGDHAINNHNFYHIEPETVAWINADITRHQGNYAFTFDANNQASLSENGTVDWAGVGDAYFAMAAIPATPSQGLEYRASRYEVQTRPFYESIFQWALRNAKTSETRHLVSVHMPITTDGSVTKIFTGTKDYFLLNSLNQPLSDQVGRPVEITNLINFSNYWWLRWLTKPLSIPILYALNFFNGLTHNYGVAIIVFTFLFYSLLFPLRWSQSKSFKKASGNAPKMKEIQDKIKDLTKKGVPNDDPRMRALQMEQLKMTKDALPIGGCLPMLLQFPLLIAFYTAVTVSLEVRQASFLWLPDLSAADPWHVLEFAFAISMVLSMKFTPTAATVTPEQQMQQKMMTYFMPVMMLWVMWSAPSGLLLYWFFGNIVSFGQQMVINHMNKPKDPTGTEIVSSVPANAKKVKQKLGTA
ncbi:MAG: membrane protein insertase YidC [Pyrinomonadaceae bacterium]|nr:membrane protein insertase YidC [Pyrinomonadaceae bacterium]MBP6211514.1 membrane protein insertase YidC [Pyrinomonadaceae bacterium]